MSSAPPPDPPADAGARYTVAAVARRLGVAPSTLRTWDRRYGVGPTGHSFGQHRRFTEDDLARLRDMRRLTLDGVAPAEAARLVLSGAGSAGEPTSAPEPVRGAPPAETARRHPGGGRVLRLPGAEDDVRGLARAAMALDGVTARSMIRRSVQEHGVATAWHGLVVPVLRAVGERWEATGQGVEVEHLLAESALSVLRGAAVSDPLTPVQVLLACAPDDYHALPVHVLAAALAEKGIACRNLGASVPADALADAVRRVGPAVVFLWSSLRKTGDPAALRAVPATAPPASVLVGGAGWWLEDLPPRVGFARDLPHAVALVGERLGL